MKVRLKPIWWILIIGGIILIILGIVLTIVLITQTSWWWFFGTLIAIFVIGAISGLFFLLARWSNRQPVVTRQDPQELKKKVIESIKYDEDNPDNFIVENQRIYNVGDPSKPKTQLIHFWGKGSESGTKIDVIANLMTPKLEITRIDGGITEEQKKDIIRQMAENPEPETSQKTTMAYDPFGRPITTIESKGLTSIAEKEQQQQQKEADLQNAL